MSISTNAYQQVNFLQYFNESGLGVEDIVNKWNKVVPYRQKYINKEEVGNIADLVADPNVNGPLLSLIMGSLARGERLMLENYDRLVYNKPIEGSVLNFEDENIRQLEKMLRKKDLGRKIVTDLEKDHLKKQGINLDNFVRGDKFGNINAMVTLDTRKMQYFQAIFNNNIVIHIGASPHIYNVEDKEFLSSIIYHEVRHAYDAYFTGIKQGEYDFMSLQNHDPIEMRKYYKSLAESRAYTDQIIYLIGKYKTKFNLTTEQAIKRIKMYLVNTSNKFCKDFPPVARELFSSFADNIAKNPKLAGFSEESAIVHQYEDVETMEKIGKLYESIMESFRFSHNHPIGEK